MLNFSTWLINCLHFGPIHDNCTRNCLLCCVFTVGFITVLYGINQRCYGNTVTCDLAAILLRYLLWLMCLCICYVSEMPHLVPVHTTSHSLTVCTAYIKWVKIKMPDSYENYRVSLKDEKIILLRFSVASFYAVYAPMPL